LLIVFSSFIVNIHVSYTDLTIFDETLIYGLEKKGQSTQIAIGTIAFAPNGTLFVNYEFNVYKLLDGNYLESYDIRPKKNATTYYDLGSYYGIAVAPNGTLYVSVNKEAYGWIYRVVNGKVFWEKYVFKRTGPIKELAFRSDGELFFTDGESIYSITDGVVFTRNSVWKEKITISSIAFAPDGTLFASVRYDYPNYDVIVRRVHDSWRLVYVRPVCIDRWGIDNIAISLNGDIYFEDHDPYWGQLYKLAYKNQVSIENEDFYLGSIYPVASNSTVLDYSYSVGELKLNVTGLEGTHGVLILPVFRSNYPDGLEVQVESNGYPLEFNMTESSTAYLISFKYSHENVTALKILLTSITPHFEEPNDFLTVLFYIVLSGTILATTVSVVIYKRKIREAEHNAKLSRRNKGLFDQKNLKNPCYVEFKQGFESPRARLKAKV
jgi:hypothetical protein